MEKQRGGERMQPIQRQEVQSILDQFTGQAVYIHLETTNGAYAGLHSESATPVGAYIRNGQVTYTRGTITGAGSYRVGLKMENGWIYAEGLTDWEVDDAGRLLLAGHDREGRLAVALELSLTPFVL